MIDRMVDVMKKTTAEDGVVISLWYICPGCKADSEMRKARGDKFHGGTGMHHVIVPPWTWNGDLEKPTLGGSVLVEGGSSSMRCHSFVADGQVQFLNDCGHEMRGMTVPLEPLPDWFVER